MKVFKYTLILFPVLYFLIINLGELVVAVTFNYGLPPALTSFYNVLIGTPLICILIYNFIKNIKIKNSQFMYLVGNTVRIAAIAGFFNSIMIIVYSFVFSDYFPNLKRYNQSTISQTSASYETIQTSLSFINPYASAIGSFILVIIGAFLVSILTTFLIERKKL